MTTILIIRTAVLIASLTGVTTAANDIDQNFGACIYPTGYAFPFNTYCNKNMYVRYTSGIPEETTCGKASFTCNPEKTKMTVTITYFDPKNPHGEASSYNLEYKGQGVVHETPIGDPQTLLKVIILSHDSDISGNNILCYYICSDKSRNGTFAQKSILSTRTDQDVHNQLKVLHHAFSDGNLYSIPNSCP